MPAPILLNTREIYFWHLRAASSPVCGGVDTGFSCGGIQVSSTALPWRHPQRRQCRSFPVTVNWSRWSTSSHLLTFSSSNTQCLGHPCIKHTLVWYPLVLTSARTKFFSKSFLSRTEYTLQIVGLRVPTSTLGSGALVTGNLPRCHGARKHHAR